MQKKDIDKLIRLGIGVFLFLIIFKELIPIILTVFIFFALQRIFTSQPIVPVQYQHYIPDNLSFLKKTINFNKNNYNNIKTMETIKTKGPKKSGKFVAYVFVLVILLALALNSFVIIEAGSTGVQSLFGKVKDEELPSGFNIKNPFMLVHKMNIRTQEYTMSIVNTEGKKSGNDSISALTKEGLQVDLDITILFHLMENKASDVYRDIGPKYEDVVIRPQIRSTIREVTAQYETKDIYSEKREEATEKILELIRESVNPRGIEVEEVLLRNVNLPDRISQSIQEKLQAEQEAQRYEFLLQREEKEAQRKRVEAEGQRDAQKIINESLTARYLEYLYIQSLKDREGTIYVPTSPNTGMPLFRGI
jgi:regulator of protease activity HflC (stomatin/prohibitin superfamily)